MKPIHFYAPFLMLLLAFLAVSATAQPVSAHAAIEADPYRLEIGFLDEPPVQGQSNSLDLFVYNTETHQPAVGLEKTLTAEFVSGSFRQELDLVPQTGLDGAYSAAFTPPQAGEYSWHVFGQILDTPVDVSMTSGPDTFEPVQPSVSSTHFAFSPGAIILVIGIAILLLAAAAFTLTRRMQRT